MVDLRHFLFEAHVVGAAVSSLTACTGLQGGEPHDDGSAESTVASGDEFCEAMAHLIVLLEPAESSSPSQTRKRFEEGGLVRAGFADRVLFAERSPLPSAAAYAALVATGIAVEVWWGRRRPETAADGAATFVMAWVLAASLVPVWIVERVARAWELDAPWVLVVSIVLVIGGTIGRGA